MSMTKWWLEQTARVFDKCIKQSNELKISLLQLERRLKGELVNYSLSYPPTTYRCGTCGAHGCKLWREYNTCADHQTLECCDCASNSQKVDISSIDTNGCHLLGTEYGLNWGNDARTDQIGYRVPAVPTEDGDTYWGYTSTPREGVAWWRRLPTRMP